MPIITKILQQKRFPNRRSVHLDGSFAFGCNVNTVARFRLREGMSLTDDQLREIELGDVKQACLDEGFRFLKSRFHSTAELRRKLMRNDWGQPVIDAVLADLTRLGYLDDARFAKAKALSAARHKHHGRRRAMAELLRSGVKSDVANRALDEIYSDASESLATARQLALKQSPRLKKLDPLVARRRLVGMLQRRGFGYETIKPVIDEVLAHD